MIKFRCVFNREEIDVPFVSDLYSRIYYQENITDINKQFNLAINTDDYFVLASDEYTFYTKNGIFCIDKEGFITNSLGYKVKGFLIDENHNITENYGLINISNDNLAPKATNNVNVTINFDAFQDLPKVPFLSGFTLATPPSINSYNYSHTMQIYDSLGNKHIMTMYYVKTPMERTLNVHIGIDKVDVTPKVKPAPIDYTHDVTTSHTQESTRPFTIVLDNEYRLVVNKSDLISFTFKPDTHSEVYQNITVNVSSSQRFPAAFNFRETIQDGYLIKDVEVLNDGIIRGKFDNGKTVQLGQIALAEIPNPREMEEIQYDHWETTKLSGEAILKKPKLGSLNVSNSRSLEDIRNRGHSFEPLSTRYREPIIIYSNFEKNNIEESQNTHDRKNKFKSLIASDGLQAASNAPKGYVNSALSGLQAASNALKLHGNNIPNASTSASNGSRDEFRDFFAEGSLGSSANTIGTGVKLTAVSKEFPQVNIQEFNPSLNLAGINDSGFFALNEDEGRSRAGAFRVDKEENISNNQRQNLIESLTEEGNIEQSPNCLTINNSDVVTNDAKDTNTSNNITNNDLNVTSQSFRKVEFSTLCSSEEVEKENQTHTPDDEEKINEEYKLKNLPNKKPSLQ